jgi:hypothetical protein
MRAHWWAVPVLCVAGVAGCDPDGGPAAASAPLVETTAPRYLEDELARVAEDVQAALESSDAEESTARLEDAATRLEALTAVYLPLYRARVEAANALRLYAGGESADAERALGRAEEMILTVSRGSPGRMERELETAAAQVGRARVAVAGDSGEAEPNLRRLVETLTDLLERAGLVL